MRKSSVLGIKNLMSAAVRGGARRERPPWIRNCDIFYCKWTPVMNIDHMHYMSKQYTLKKMR